jgi:hypothetical protein
MLSQIVEDVYEEVQFPHRVHEALEQGEKAKAEENAHVARAKTDREEWHKAMAAYGVSQAAPGLNPQRLGLPTRYIELCMLESIMYCTLIMAQTMGRGVRCT